MTARVLLSCDGTRPPGSSEQCRGWVAFDFASKVAVVRKAAARAGWSYSPETGDLCHSCTRAKAQTAQPSAEAEGRREAPFVMASVIDR